jgi:hypothetical protein
MMGYYTLVSGQGLSGTFAIPTTSLYGIPFQSGVYSIEPATLFPDLPQNFDLTLDFIVTD